MNTDKRRFFILSVLICALRVCGPQFSLPQRQAQPKTSALTRIHRRDLPAMPLDNGLDDSQPQAAAGLSGGVAPAMEEAEQLGQVGRRDADAGIFHP